MTPVSFFGEADANAAVVVEDACDRVMLGDAGYRETSSSHSSGNRNVKKTDAHDVDAQSIGSGRLLQKVRGRRDCRVGM